MTGARSRRMLTVIMRGVVEGPRSVQLLHEGAGKDRAGEEDVEGDKEGAEPKQSQSRYQCCIGAIQSKRFPQKRPQQPQHLPRSKRLQKRNQRVIRTIFFVVGLKIIMMSLRRDWVKMGKTYVAQEDDLAQLRAIAETDTFMQVPSDEELKGRKLGPHSHRL